MTLPRPIARLLLTGIVSLTGITLSACAQTARTAIPAFPGAEGFGAYTTGGRGGAVYLVTTLADYGEEEDPVPGSLRAAVEASGARNVVFRVAGYIDLVRPLVVEHPNLTIAGQTAPGEGVTLRYYGMDVAAPQTIIRHLRIRLGDSAGIEQDALNIRSPDVIVDHCSVSWGTDETLSIIGAADDVTVQWCIISESLNESVHSKGAHGYGTLITATGDVSIHHTAYVLHASRNPRPKSLTLDFRNNLVYGYGGQAGYNADDFTYMNYVGNYLHPLAHSRHPECAFTLGGLNSRFYVTGNRFAGLDHPPTGDWDAICMGDVDPAAAADRVRLDQPIPAAFVTTHDAGTARAMILDDAGATKPARDAVDRRLVDLMRAGEGHIIDSQDEVGGWPPLRSEEPPADADRDGLPDAWESLHELDPLDPADQARDADADGYTNLEEFFNGTNPRVAFAWVEPPSFEPASGSVFADSSIAVTMAVPEGASRVHYTTDGTDPDSTSPVYAGPIRLDQTAQIRALSVAPGNVSMPVFAVYERLTWQSALPEMPDGLMPGLRYAYYEADDWDEGENLDALEPLRSGRSAGVDFARGGDAPVHALTFDGYLDVPDDRVYAFHLTDDYRSELHIDGRLVTRGKPDAADPGYAALRQGWHAFHLRLLRESPVAEPALRWSFAGSEAGPVPDSLFSHRYPTP